jgi:malate synthase
MPLTVVGPHVSGSETILTPGAKDFLEKTVRTFRTRHRELMQKRVVDRARIRAGELKLDFDPATRDVREGSWPIADLASEFWKPGIELTGPAGNRKMVINALNSGAVRYMADSEDSESPTWRNILNGQINLRDAVREIISYHDCDSGRDYFLTGTPSKLMYRPRGLHLPEPHVLVDDEPVPAQLFDVGMYLYHNAQELRMQQKAIHLYMPKTETASEAAYINEYLLWMEHELHGDWYGVKTTFLNENIRATFQSHEILWETRLRSAGFNVGRYDKMASDERMLFRTLFPERQQVTMAVPHLDGYVDYVGQACYQHKAPFCGGMEAQIPVKANAAFSATALEKAKAGKMREAYEKGCVRAWVAHPGMVASMQEIFQNRPDGWEIEAKKRYAGFVRVSAEQLTTVPAGTVTMEGICQEVDAYLKYVAGWLCGTGAVAIDYYTKGPDDQPVLAAYLMEDAATAEQARTHLHKCILLGATLDDGRLIDRLFVGEAIRNRLTIIKGQVGGEKYINGRYLEACDLLIKLLESSEEDFPEYLTEHALPQLIEFEKEV